MIAHPCASRDDGFPDIRRISLGLRVAMSKN